MAEKLRIHTLSKELGVTSKAILEKCKREGVEGVTNHMSTLSAGLAETIREWFSADMHGTAVEEAAPVDLEKVRVRRRKPKTEPATEESVPESEPEVQVQVMEPEAPAADEVVESAEPAEPVASPVEVAAEAPAVAVDQIPAEEPTAEVAAPIEVSTVVEEPPTPVAAETVTPPVEAVAAEAPAEPETPAVPLAPAGPQNVPAPARMQGPRVVRFAKPDVDVISRPAPRGPSRPPRFGESDMPMQAAGGRRGKGMVGGADDDRKNRNRISPRRSRGSLNEVGERLKEWNDRDLLERRERLEAASGKGIHARRAKERTLTGGTPHIAPRKTKAQVNEPVIVHELCAATGIGLNQIWPRLKSDHDLLVQRNSVIPTDIAQMVMLDLGVELEVVKPKTELEKLQEEFATRERKNLRRRAPVVTMLGHVDHGKTSLLDMIRKTSVAEGEAGGITQHIGAYRVERGDLSVTFLDTPGHEAFTSMRARGANMTDVVVLVVAADDGLMPQTIEAINHAKAAGVTIVVALNKIDLPGVDINKIYGQLSEMQLVPTEWGGETDVIKTSAVTGEGIEQLISHLAMLSDLLELKADPVVPATGVVIEAEMQQGMGPLARVLLREGTLKTGDLLVCGPGAGRVRSMRDYRGRRLDKATPGMPVEVSGLDEVPNAGDTFYCVESLQRAKTIAAETRDLRRAKVLTQLRKPKTLDDLFQQRQAGQIPELNLILKADVQGSVDALLKMLGEIPSDQVKLNFLHTGIGTITEGDVVLASASDAMIVGFNTTVDAEVKRLADNSGVDIRTYRIIYEVGDEIRKALEGLLPRDRKEESRGRAEVREVFRVSKVGTIAGCMVTDGIIARSHNVRVIRDGQIVVPTADDVKRERHRGIDSLKRFKDDAKEVRAGMECGIRVEDFDDVKPGDVIEAYEVIEIARKL